jgi:hypothetical protein
MSEIVSILVAFGFLGVGGFIAAAIILLMTEWRD